MQTRNRSNSIRRRNGTPYGKCACVSFSGLELDLMDDWQKLAESECLDKSAYFKKFLRGEARKLRDQQSTNWAEMYAGRR